MRLRLSKEPSNHSALPVLTTEMVRPIVKLCILYDGWCEDIPVLKVILGANKLKVTLTLKKKKNNSKAKPTHTGKFTFTP